MKGHIEYDVFAYFPCNGGGVRVAVRRQKHDAERFADRFAKLNRCETGWRMRWVAV